MTYDEEIEALAAKLYAVGEREAPLRPWPPTREWEAARWRNAARAARGDWAYPETERIGLYGETGEIGFVAMYAAPLKAGGSWPETILYITPHRHGGGPSYKVATFGAPKAPP